MVRLIITHPGGSHKDDLLAVCVLIALHGAPVARREPTQDELKDPEVAVVDIGGDHDASLNNYDHHHFPREHPPTCALSLVFQGMGLYKDALSLCDWLEPAEWFDSRGPNKTAVWLGVPRKAISQLNSPIDVTLLRRFASLSEVSPDDVLYQWLKMVGEDLLRYLRDAKARIAQVAQVAQHWSIKAKGQSIPAVFLPRKASGVDEPSQSLANYIRRHCAGNPIAATVYPDRRGEGYGIGRYEDHPSLDFSRVENEPDVHFAHKSGFMCKTTATDPARLKELIALAWS